MGSKPGRKVFEIVEIVVLSTLLLIRLLFDSEENNWVNLLNFASLVVAFVSLYINVRTECLQYKKFDSITGCFVLILVALMVVFSFILAGKIPLNTKCNDVILIITLLLTLPSKLYSCIIANIIKNK